jgi:hypothetical protein
VGLGWQSQPNPTIQIPFSLRVIYEVHHLDTGFLTSRKSWLSAICSQGFIGVQGTFAHQL